MQKLIAWFAGVPFILMFSVVMVTFDIIMRIGVALSKKFYEPILVGLCNSVLYILRITGFRWEIEGQSNLSKLEPRLPLLVIANHQSLMDIPMLYLAFPGYRLRFVAKRELTRFLPFVSFALRQGGHAVIDRNDGKGALSQLNQYAEEHLESGLAVCIFPEGTRARSGELRPFKSGGVAAIIKACNQINVVPVAVINSWKLARWKLMPVPLGVRVTIKLFEPRVCSAAETDINTLVQNIRSDISSAQV
jgi:1-acyl-sn-glycerol-3-phosphate acyltransferase